MNVTDILNYGHQTLVRSVEGLPDSEWHKSGVCGVWSVKDIVGHLASYEHLLVEVLSSFLGSGPTPYMNKMAAGLEQFNDNEVALRQDKSVAEVMAEYNETHAQVMGLARQIPAETFRQNGTLPWYGPEYDLDDFIVYSYYGHKREHSAQIAVFRDQNKI
jgi:hypothetical protein